MSYFNLKFRVDFLRHVKNVKINILFSTVYLKKKKGKRLLDSNIYMKSAFCINKTFTIESIALF